MNNNFIKIIPWIREKNHWSEEVGVNKRIQIKGTNNQVIISNDAIFHNLQIIIHGNNNKLVIANKCLVSGFIEMFGSGNEITIGQGTGILGVGLTAHAGKYIKIGEKCLIARGTDIRTTDSHPIWDEDGKRINPDDSIEIGDRVWIAPETKILKGTIIGNDVVIGTRSLLNKSIIPSNTLAAGSPAKVVRENITWSV
ncbi:MAG: acyltransferase [Nostocales cyanobacterium]|nr:MAG: acyltransferase [Nostocales cyanobacterium]TAF14217.1 MAG: acyltransferase [Nostocales cyanobacterium]